MSQQNVELVRAQLVPPDVDLVALFRDEEGWGRLVTVWSHHFREDFETVVSGLPMGEKSYIGVAGQHGFWEDWLEPWVEYRQELRDIVDLGDRVLLLFHDFGLREDSTKEIRGETAGIWTIREGRFARAEFYLSHAEALNAAGLNG